MSASEHMQMIEDCEARESRLAERNASIVKAAHALNKVLDNITRSRT